jgi:hypothetical protein
VLADNVSDCVFQHRRNAVEVDLQFLARTSTPGVAVNFLEGLAKGSRNVTHHLNLTTRTFVSWGTLKDEAMLLSKATRLSR